MSQPKPNMVIRYLRRAPHYTPQEIEASALKREPLPFRKGEPYAAVIAFKSRKNGLMVGWSYCCPKDRWNKREAILTALHRSQPASAVESAFFDGCPEKARVRMQLLVQDVKERATHYYEKKSTPKKRAAKKA